MHSYKLLRTTGLAGSFLETKNAPDKSGAKQ